MLAFGCAVTDDDLYESCALPGIELAREPEPDTPILTFGSSGSVFRSYNLLLEKAKEHGGLEAFVILHQDAEITDPDFLAKIRAALTDPEVALVGCAGAVDVRSIAWWEGSVTWASFTHRFEEYGGGELPALTWLPDKTPVYAGTGEVDTIDGFVMAFSPWAIENLRFDETIGGALHGYDFDICMQARAAGKKVVTADLRVIHHHSLVLIRGVEGWMEAHIKLAEKWNDSLPIPTEDWRRRARMAEAQAAAVRLGHGASELICEWRMAALQDEMDRIEGSLSWRITAPLRWVARLLRGGKPKRVKTVEPEPLPASMPGQAATSDVELTSDEPYDLTGDER